MKRKPSRHVLTLSLCLLLALVFALPASAYDYDRKALYDDEYPLRLTMTLRERLADRGNPDYDVDAFVDSEMGEAMIDLLLLHYTVEDEMDPAVLSHWRERGVTKELHGDPDSPDRWAVYYPSRLDMSGAQSYPLLFVLHGSGAPAYRAETYGYVELLFDSDIIIVMPENNDTVMRVLDDARAAYPVDESRLYCAGHSAGGVTTAKTALENPGVFAAVHVGGVNPSVGRSPTDASLVTEAERRLMVFGAYETVFVSSTGLQDMHDNYPLSVANDGTLPGDVKVSALNVWQALNHCALTNINQSITLSAISNDIVKRKIGIDFDRTEVRTLYGTSFYIGAQTNSSGMELMYFFGVENAPHFSVPGVAETAWELMAPFSRDLETGRLRKAA